VSRFSQWTISNGESVLLMYSKPLIAAFNSNNESVGIHFSPGGQFDVGGGNVSSPLDQQHEQVLRWLSLRDHIPGPHLSGKVAVVGHTPQKEVLNLGHLICLDTGCATGGKLTAMDIGSEEVWEARTVQ